MKKITYLILSAIALLVLVSACQNNKSADGGERPDPTEVAKIKADPAASKDLKTALNGRWRSTTDDKSVVIFAGGKMTQIYNGRIMKEEALEIFPSCPEACSAGRDLADMACFSTRSQYSVTCYVITSLENDKLEYAQVGGVGNTLSFERVVDQSGSSGQQNQ